jgi:hypothetical protein
VWIGAGAIMLQRGFHHLFAPPLKGPFPLPAIATSYWEKLAAIAEASVFSPHVAAPAPYLSLHCSNDLRYHRFRE